MSIFLSSLLIFQWIIAFSKKLNKNRGKMFNPCSEEQYHNKFKYIHVPLVIQTKIYISSYNGHFLNIYSWQNKVKAMQCPPPCLPPTTINQRKVPHPQLPSWWHSTSTTIFDQNIKSRKSKIELLQLLNPTSAPPQSHSGLFLLQLWWPEFVGCKLLIVVLVRGHFYSFTTEFVLTVASEK